MKLDHCGCFPTGRHYPGIAHLIQVRVVGLAEEIDPDANWIDQRIAFVDTETTGVDPKVDRVIEVGIVIGMQKGAHVGLLLPQVAVEYNCTGADFLDLACRKAGLPEDAWRGSGVTISTFEAEVFSE